MKRVAIAALALGIAIGGVALNRKAIQQVFGDLLFPNDTIYSDGFTESAFSTLRVDMSRREVEALLGGPLFEAALIDGTVVERRSLESGEVVYRSRTASEEAATGYRLEYSRPGPKYDNYYVRAIDIDRNGKVVAVHQSFYSD